MNNTACTTSFFFRLFQNYLTYSCFFGEYHNTEFNKTKNLKYFKKI